MVDEKIEEEDDSGECPKCHSRVDYLDYRCDITEYGHFIPNDFMEANDSSDGDNYVYSCPECSCDLTWEESEEAFDQKKKQKW